MARLAPAPLQPFQCPPVYTVIHLQTKTRNRASSNFGHSRTAYCVLGGSTLHGSGGLSPGIPLVTHSYLDQDRLTYQTSGHKSDGLSHAVGNRFEISLSGSEICKGEKGNYNILAQGWALFVYPLQRPGHL